MKRYELLYIAPGTLTENDAGVVYAAVTTLLQEKGAQVTQEVSLDKKRLAYPIQNQRYGYYRLVEFTAEPSALPVLKDGLRLSRELLRHLIIEKPVKSQATLEREQALRDRLAARRQQRASDTASATAASATAATAPTLTAEELDQKLSRILEESPDA